MTIYSQQKPTHHVDRLYTLGKAKKMVPVHVHLILSDLCNQDCAFCAYRMGEGLSNELFPQDGKKNPNRMIATDKATQIIRDCAILGVKAMQFTGGGEPTVHPDHLELFRLAQMEGMETALVTNGVRLDPGSDAIRRMTWIRVSVDAGDAETYARVRNCPPAHWGKVWANVAALVDNAYTGTLGIGYVVTPDNWAGVLNAARMAKAAGVSNMRVGAVFSALGTAYYGPEIARIGDAIAEAKAQVDGEGFVLNDLFGRRIGDLEEGHPEDEFCGYQHFTWYIGGDLTVYRCCNTAYTRAGAVGSLKDQRVVDIIGQHEPFDARACRHCQFLGQNKAIASSLNPPEHVNFV